MQSDSSSQCVDALRSFNHVKKSYKVGMRLRRTALTRTSKTTPKISEARQHTSLSDKPLDLDLLSTQVRQNDEAPRTYLYLAYGSNLCALTFRERRGIQPLSQTNVVVPEISLTFDLPGIPYTEPCFGNCRYRVVDEKSEVETDTEDYHKNRWRKGLVGVVYEVTEKDYVHIIETEGGGSGYKDVLVDCFALDNDPNMEVPMVPTGTPFKAHTLFAPTRSRPDPAYAQPSERYKKLITDGAEECDLPHEYRTYLDGIRAYHLTTQKQRLGQWIFATLWLPILGFIFLGGGKIFLGKDGKYPPWFARFANAVFAAVWDSYDNFFKPTFGDGERSIEDGGSDTVDRQGRVNQEKTPLLASLRSEKTRVIQETV